MIPPPSSPKANLEADFEQLKNGVMPSNSFSITSKTPTSAELAGTKLSFEFNPLSPIFPEGLISKEDRGDTKIMSDALNKIFAYMAEDRAKMNLFMQRSEERFFHLRETVGSLSDRMGTLECTSKEYDKTIAFLNEDKLSCSEFEDFRTEINEFKESCLDELKGAIQVNSNQQLAIDQQQLELNALRELKQTSLSQQAIIESQQVEIARLHLENDRLAVRQSIIAEKQNVQEMHRSISIMLRRCDVLLV